MSASSKDVIYVDVDDEITSIIEKVRASNEEIVALVLPKRSTVMQSIVNMKLLNKSSKEVDKQVVLITSEAGLLPLAGSVGVLVSKNLQTKPEIPTTPDENTDEEVVNPEDLEEIDKDTPVGALAGVAATAAVVSSVDGADEVIELDNDDIGESTDKDEPKTDDKKDKKAKKGDKKLKVPNFNKFRTRMLIIGAAGVAFLIFLYFGFFVWPRAKVVVTTDSKSVAVNVDVIVSTSVKEANIDEGIIPGESKKVNKTETAKAPATGTKDVGTKATGQVSIRNCQSSSSIPISAGTRFTASGGKVFTANYGVTVPAISADIGADCDGNANIKPGTVSLAVTALENGDSYNIDATSFSSPTLSSCCTTTSSNKMTGGTSKTVTAVSQTDVDTATKKISDKKDSYKAELKTQLEQAGLKAIEESFTCTAPSVNVSPAVGSEGNEVTVTSSTDCTMVGVKEEELRKVIENDVRSQEDIGNQALLDDGLSTATYTVTNPETGKTGLNITTVAKVGPDINPEQLKSEIAGKKKGEAENIIKNTPGVKDAKVSLSPFWVNKVPGKNSKINITFENAQ